MHGRRWAAECGPQGEQANRDELRAARRCSCRRGEARLPACPWPAQRWASCEPLPPPARAGPGYTWRACRLPRRHHLLHRLHRPYWQASAGARQAVEGGRLPPWGPCLQPAGRASRAGRGGNRCLNHGHTPCFKHVSHLLVRRIAAWPCRACCSTASRTRPGLECSPPARGSPQPPPSALPGSGRCHLSG